MVTQPLLSRSRVSLFHSQSIVVSTKITKLLSLQKIIIIRNDYQGTYLVKLFNFNLFLQGFERVFNSFADIQLDIPNAHTLLETFTDMCARDGIIPISLTIKVPSRYVMSVL